MYRKIVISICFVALLFLSGCDGLKTPEELIGPPEVDVNKKQINDIIQGFLPTDAELLVIPQGRNSRNPDSVYRSNFDADEEEEIIALYRDKNERKIGVLVIDQSSGIWSKVFELNIEAFEISDYAVTDLNNDGMNEIILGYFSINDPYKELIVIGRNGTGLQKIYELKYQAIDLNNKTKDNETVIAVSTEGSSGNNNKFTVLKYKEDMIQKSGELIYPENVEIYKILYDKINESQKAYFVDMYVNEGTGKTDVISFSENELFSLIKKNNLAEIIQEIPRESSDINGDGIIEVIRNRIIEENKGVASLVLSLCYNINKSGELNLLNKMYVDYESNVEVSLPVVTDAEIIAKKIGEHFKLFYHSKKLDRNIEMLDIVRTDSRSIEEYSKEYLQVIERYDEIILAKLTDNTILEGAEKKEFEKLYDIMKKPSEIIRFVE